MTTKKTTTKKPVKKTDKPSPEKIKVLIPATDTHDSIYKAVKDISIARSVEIEIEDPERSQAICDLADLAGSTFLQIVEPSIGGSAKEKTKDVLLILQLMYSRISSEMLQGIPLDMTSEIPISGKGSVEPLCTKENTVQMYY